ncbi:LADA_0A04016g1_1 [Lachancea dasiensis]|uniref:precorrin-2 dehydrogenase n=1 Tax=Lachancea dasiensis TaxID=1072105 RepID=A0A1G4INV1_9SACH|nr:LADA_0A04016g1_1 [Lachancea dasiensis]
MLSLQLAHQLAGKNVLLVGAGEVAMTRIPKLLPTGCKLTVIAPHIHPDMWGHIDATQDPKTDTYVDLEWNLNKNKIYQIIQREFNNKDLILFGDGLYSNVKKEQFLNDELDSESADNLDLAVSGWHLILTCIPDPKLSEKIYRGAKIVLGQHVLCNVADNPPLCDFYFGSNVILGSDENGGKPIQILISSNGNSPRFTALLKQEIQQQFGSVPIGASVGKLGDLRSRVRHISEGGSDSKLNRLELIKYRMEWIRNCTDAFGVTHCHEIDVEKTTQLFSNMFANLSLDLPEREIMLQEYLEGTQN